MSLDGEKYNERGLDRFGNMQGTGLYGESSAILDYLHGAADPFTPAQVTAQSPWDRDDVRGAWDNLTEQGCIAKQGRRWVVTDAGRQVIAARRALGRLYF